VLMFIPPCAHGIMARFCVYTPRGTRIQVATAR